MGSCDYIERARRIMRADRHVVRFGKYRDPLHFRDPAGPTDVWHDVVDQTFLQVGSEVPTRVFALSDTEVDVGVASQLAVGVKTFWLKRFLEPGQVELHHAIAEFSGC